MLFFISTIIITFFRNNSTIDLFQGKIKDTAFLSITKKITKCLHHVYTGQNIRTYIIEYELKIYAICTYEFFS